jgi:hypothetical protein
MNSEPENRRSFRMFESVHLTYELISDREFHEGRVHRKVRLGTGRGLRSAMLDLDARLTERLYLLRAESGVAAECVALLNEKIGLLLEQMPNVRRPKSSLAKREPQVCELGADGMVFGTEKRIGTGTRLALRFLLSSSHRYIETFCTVVREAPPPDPGDPRHPFGVGVEFVDLEASQREIIIQHLFNRESESLRARRQQLDG